VEAGFKTVIGARCKQSSMFWRCVASTAVGAWTRSGNAASINTPDAMTRSPCPPDEEFCPPPELARTERNCLSVRRLPASLIVDGEMAEWLKAAVC